MIEIVNVADLKDPDDPQGRSYRQVNAERTHAYPIGSLVELKSNEDYDYGGERLYVKYHGRDCDQTPLYSLGLKNHENKYQWSHGFSEESMKLIFKPVGT